MRRTVDFILGPEVRPQDAKLFVASLLASNDSRDLAWELIRKRWSELQKKTGEFVGNTVIVSALAAFCDATTAKEIRSFFETQQGAGRGTHAAAVARTHRVLFAARDCPAPKLDAWPPSRAEVGRSRR